MEMVMCRSCGEFIPASMKDGMRVPRKDACPQCDGQEFKDIHEDRIIRIKDDGQLVDSSDQAGVEGA